MAKKKADMDFLSKPVTGKEILPLIHGIDELNRINHGLELRTNTILYHIKKHNLPGFEDYEKSAEEYQSYASYCKMLYDAPLTHLAELLKNYPQKDNELLKIDYHMYDLQKKLQESGMEIQDMLNYLDTLAPYDPSVKEVAELLKLEAERKARAGLLKDAFLEDNNGNKYPVKFHTDPTDQFNIKNHFLDFTPETKGMNLQIFMQAIMAGLKRVCWTSPSGSQELHPALPMKMIQVNPLADGGVRIILQYTQPSA